jgi:hypothetical protein
VVLSLVELQAVKVVPSVGLQLDRFSVLQGRQLEPSLEGWRALRVVGWLDTQPAKKSMTKLQVVTREYRFCASSGEAQALEAIEVDTSAEELCERMSVGAACEKFWEGVAHRYRGDFL